MKLLWSSRSPFVRKVVVVAHELGIADRILLDRVNVTGKETNAEVMRLQPAEQDPHARARRRLDHDQLARHRGISRRNLR